MHKVLNNSLILFLNLFLSVITLNYLMFAIFDVKIEKY